MRQAILIIIQTIDNKSFIHKKNTLAEHLLITDFMEIYIEAN